MVKHYNLTLSGAIQNLNTVLPVNEGDLLKFFALQADGGNSGIIYVGSAEIGTVSSSNYGFRIEIPTASVPVAPDIIELGQNGVSLAEFIVIGTLNDILHILTVR